MIIIADEVYKVIDEYSKYLINEGLTSRRRAHQKRIEILQALNKNLGGLRSFPFSKYKSFGEPQGYRIYVYKDPKSKSQWGFIHQEFDNGSENVNIIVYDMKNMKLVTEKIMNSSIIETKN